MKNKMNFTIFIFLLILALIKDGLEFVIGLIPIVGLFSWLICLPLTAIIFAIIYIIGIGPSWAFIVYIIDLVPLVSVLPITTIAVIGTYLVEKSPKAKKIAKIVPKISPKNIKK